ncbi:hypothetical protein JCM3774_002301 [Rhodotorula dairenensis]
MLHAAAQHLHRAAPSSTPTPAAAAAAPPRDRDGEQRTRRRLSRISPSDFDSVLSGRDTVRLHSRDSDPSASDAVEVVATPPTRDGSSRDLAAGSSPGTSKSTSDGTGISGKDPTGQRNAPLASAHSAVLDSAAGTPADQSTLLPDTYSAGVRDDGLAHYDSLVAVGAIDSPRKPRSRHGSSAPPESAPVVAPDAVAGRANLLPPPSGHHSSVSSATTRTGTFGFSPRRRRVQGDEPVQEKVCRIDRGTWA